MAHEGCPKCGRTKVVGQMCEHCVPDTLAEGVPSGTRVICTQCGAMASTGRKVTKGSFFVEIVLWLMMILPGVLYTVWRLTSRATVCRTCGQPTLIPIDSPMAKRQIAQLRASDR